ncbi:unnamed protein product [Sphacelaria rigidula]
MYVNIWRHRHTRWKISPVNEFWRKTSFSNAPTFSGGSRAVYEMCNVFVPGGTLCSNCHHFTTDILRKTRRRSGVQSRTPSISGKVSEVCSIRVHGKVLHGK